MVRLGLIFCKPKRSSASTCQILCKCCLARHDQVPYFAGPRGVSDAGKGSWVSMVVCLGYIRYSEDQLILRLAQVQCSTGPIVMAGLWVVFFLLNVVQLKLHQIFHRPKIIVRVRLCCIFHSVKRTCIRQPCLSHLVTNKMMSGTVHDLHQKFCSYETSLNTN